MVAMKVLSAEEMQTCDRVTSERHGVSSIELMRSAAAAIDAFARQQFPRARRVTVICGRGNNGGDGMMAARLLSKAGLEVTTVLLGSQYELKGDAATAWRELSVSPNRYFYEVNSAADLKAHNAVLGTDLIIDAVLGTGFKPPMKGLALAAMEWASASEAPFLSVDLPSGWPADSTQSKAESQTFPSDAVITFTAPKPAHVFGALTRRWDQPVVVAPIGSPEEAIASEQRQVRPCAGGRRVGGEVWRSRDGVDGCIACWCRIGDRCSAEPDYGAGIQFRSGVDDASNDGQPDGRTGKQRNHGSAISKTD
jgi:ADP-dependent NAD(P)H-hydrate dehydratase / NAD(P)H-hydrate epimerase